MANQERRRLDPVKTRGDILEAAYTNFAEKGFSGASIGDIAVSANVPKSLVQYHFGSKEELWQACLKENAAPMIDAVDEFLEDHGDIENLLEARMRMHEANPKLSRLLAWMSMGQAPPPAFISDRIARVQSKLGSRGPDLLFGLAAIDGWFLYRNLYSKFLGERVMTHEETLQFVSRLAQGGKR